MCGPLHPFLTSALLFVIVRELGMGGHVVPAGVLTIPAVVLVPPARVV